VIVANGDKLACDVMCKGFTWNLHKEEYKANIVVVPLGSCEMILGVQWLITLGTILWDFEKLMMEFTYNGKKQIIRGSHKTTVEWMDSKELKKEIDKCVRLFAV